MEREMERRREGENGNANTKYWYDSKAMPVPYTASMSGNWGSHFGKSFFFIYQSIRYSYHMTQKLHF